MNLAKLKEKKKLQKFHIQTCNKQYLQKHNLVYADDTFEHITKLEELKINIPLFMADFSAMLIALHSLKTLDLSYTSWVGMVNISKAVHATNTHLKRLILNNFQPIGRNIYNETLSFPDFFGPNNIFSNLTILTLTDNSLLSVVPSISVHTPMLEVLDISRNMIISVQNAAIILESLLHPTLICFFLEHQGVVGGNSQMFYNMTLKYKDCTKEVTHENQVITSMPKIQATAKEYNTISLASDGTSSYDETNYQTNIMETAMNKPFVFLPTNHVLACANQELRNATPNISVLVQGSIYSQQFFLNKLLRCMLSDILAFPIPVNIIPPLRNIYNPNCLMLVNIPIGRYLRVIDYSHQQWGNSYFNVLDLHRNLCFAPNNLTYLDLGENFNFLRPFIINNGLGNYSVRGLSKIDTFIFSNNHMTFDIKGSLHLFNNLNRLYYTGNYLILHPNTNMCRLLNKLEYLYLDKCNLKVYKPLPKNLVMGCSKLKLLHLGMNDLTSANLHELNFSGSNNIQLLNLTNNKLTTLTTKFMCALNNLTSKALTIDLSNNNFICTCDNRIFIEWLRNDHREHSIRIYNIKKQTCMGSKNQMINIFDKSLPVSSLDCHVVYQISLAILGCILFLIVLLFLFKMRWRLRYKLFRLKENVIKLFKCFSSSKDAPTYDYLFDAYVAYADDDLFWICHSLLKVLEKQCSFSLCIRERNFLPGYTMAELISTAIHKSRDVIIVLGRNSMNTEWFNFEMEQAIVKMNKTGRKPIIVTMGNFQSVSENSVAAGLLDTNEYIEWGDDAHAQKLFWQLMTNKLLDTGKGCCNDSNCLRCTFCLDIKESSDSSVLLSSEDCDGFCNLD